MFVAVGFTARHLPPISHSDETALQPHRSHIIQLESVELLFNLIWAAAIATLCVLWASRRRRGQKASLLPAVGIQISAMVMLSGVLLPAISITDDLQASHNPAEVQRTCDRSDRHSCLAKLPHSLPVALVLPAFCVQPSHPRVVTILTTKTAMSSQQVAARRALWSRPPPSA